MRRERLGNPMRVLGVPLHAQLQRLQPAQRQPAIERRRHRADRVLQELDRLEDRGIARQRRALDQIGMPRQVFRDAVHDDVGAEREGLLEHRRGEGVVDDDERAVLVGDVGDRLDVGHDQARVGRRLEPHQPRALGDRGAHRVEIRRINRRDGEIEAREDAIQQAERAAVDIERDDDLVVRPQVRVQHRVLGGEARREDRAVRDAFEIGEDLFEPLARRIVGARIVEAQIDAGAFLLVGRGLIDRRDQRAGRRIARLGGMNGAGREMHFRFHGFQGSRVPSR